MAATVVVASLATKNALACVPRNLTCSGKLSGGGSGHGPNGDDGCTYMKCNYSKEKHKSDCDSKGDQYHRRPYDRDWNSNCKSDWKDGTKKTWDDNHSTLGFNPGGNQGSDYSRCFKDFFGTPGNKQYKCKQTSTGSGTYKTRKWNLEKNPTTTTGYDDCTFADLISWHCKDGRWNATSSGDDDCTYAAKCCVLYLNAECDYDRVKDFPLTRAQCKGIYKSIAENTDYCPDASQPLKVIKKGDVKNWVDEICNSSHG
jgi:hypothetical protein